MRSIINRVLSSLIPGGIDADRYVHGVVKAAMCRIKQLYQRVNELSESNIRRAGINTLKRKSVMMGFILLDATTRTWWAFWGTISLLLFYIWWNDSATTHEHFDPYPYTFLMVLIAAFSYLQNIVIMTLQRQQDKEFADIKAKQDEQDLRMLHLMETATAQGRVIIQQGERDEQRAQEILKEISKILSRLTIPIG